MTVRIHHAIPASATMRLGATGERELYDLAADPEETHNAIGEREHAGAVADLYDRLCRWQRETNDSLTLPDPRL